MSNFNEFLDEKIVGFGAFLESKKIPELEKNISALKLIYQIGGLKMFIDNFLIPKKEFILNRANEREIMEFICPKHKVDDILALFTEEDKERVYQFLNFLLDCNDANAV